MDLGLNRRRRHQTEVFSDGLKELYLHDMNFYKTSPTFDISLEEFQDLALERLKVLRILEFASQKGFRPLSTEWKNFVYDQMQKENLKKFLRLIRSKGTSNPTEAELQARRADHVSHFILRLAYCRSDELRRWFLNRELELFKLRFAELSPQSVTEFLKLNDLRYTPISMEEKLELRDDLENSTSGVFIFDTTDFYKVRFTEVPNLIRARKVLLNAGMAYVPSFEIISCIITIFRAHLNEALAYASRNITNLDDDRINNLLINLHKAHTGSDYSEQKSNKNEVSLQNLNHYSKVHFPLCMRNIHESLKRDHHLKHFARLQYLLFLKGIGLLFEECMSFWREEFTKKIDGDKFEKQYSYLVKHTYGKVGSMVNYTPYSCMKIITTSVGTGEAHGCPYRHWDVNYLKQKLDEMGINANGVSEIVEMTRQGHYQIACGKFFEHTHGQENKNVVINHPNQYFEDSIILAKEKEQPNEKKIKIEESK